MTIPPRRTVTSPELADGLLVPRPSDESLRVVDDRLRALDVTGGPALIELDLSRCGHGLHLVVQGCPLLRRIVLPDWGPGAVIHLDLGEQPPRLGIDGLVDEFDAAWGTPTNRRELRSPQRRTGGRPLSGLHIGQLDRSAGDAAGVCIVEPAGIPPEVDLPRAALVMVIHADGLQSLQLGASRGEPTLEAHDCPDLTTISSASPLRRVRLRGCPALQEVKGPGRHLTVSGGSADVEAFAAPGPWREVSLHDAAPRAAHLDLAERVTITRCDSLGRVFVQEGAVVAVRAGALPEVEGGGGLQVEPLANDVFLEQVRRGDPALRKALLYWCSDDGSPRRALRGIQILRDIAKTGGDLEEVWDHRTLLYGRNAPAHRLGRTRWDWRFPPDLADRGWRADVELWAECRPTDDSAQAFARTLATSRTLEQLTALADVWATSCLDAGGRYAVADALAEALLFGEACPRAALDDPGIWGLRDACYAEDDRRLQALVATLARAREDDRCHELLQGLCGWIASREPSARGVDVLGAIRALGSKTADATLRRLAADSERLPEELRRRALMQLVAPIQADLFDFGEDLASRRTA